MNKQVLFIQGGGEGGYQADVSLVASLQNELGKDYQIIYPELKSDEDAPDFGWVKEIGEEIDKLKDGVILVAHSLGASMLLKYLSENKVAKKIAGIFLLATPHWKGSEEWKQGLKLQKDFAENLPENVPIFFYHCRDDEEVPFNQLAFYRDNVPGATFREIESGGHLLENKLDYVVTNIKDL
jgi:predicted alpha/beta hydrolase family esterase